ncbi:hypothetical protein [Nocardia nova]|uniref:hypothetical protein n=1 Tax=Nocardia nova TaxID=37330 RepID=UPI001FD1CC44|nr:hypothetical protein [Nocardia nova]
MASTSTPAPGRTEFDLGQVTLHALTWGDPAAPLALCLHGYPDTAWTWPSRTRTGRARVLRRRTVQPRIRSVVGAGRR